jgi:hypothetical protein
MRAMYMRYFLFCLVDKICLWHWLCLMNLFVLSVKWIMVYSYGGHHVILLHFYHRELFIILNSLNDYRDLIGGVQSCNPAWFFCVSRVSLNSLWVSCFQLMQNQICRIFLGQNDEYIEQILCRMYKKEC